jgi:hypothetical protein
VDAGGVRQADDQRGYLELLDALERHRTRQSRNGDFNDKLAVRGFSQKIDRNMTDLDVGYRVGPLDEEALKASSTRLPDGERHLDEAAVQKDVLGGCAQRIVCGKPARGPVYVREVREPAFGDFALQFFATRNADISGAAGGKAIARRRHIRR